LFNANLAIFQLYHGENKFNFQLNDDEAHFVLDQHAELDIYAGRHVVPIGHIILIPNQPVFALSS